MLCTGCVDFPDRDLVDGGGPAWRSVSVDGWRAVTGSDAEGLVEDAGQLEGDTGSDAEGLVEDAGQLEGDTGPDAEGLVEDAAPDLEPDAWALGDAGPGCDPWPGDVPPCGGVTADDLCAGWGVCMSPRGGCLCPR